ncbi:hypothetical protein GF391_03035 [Candidatus Uhrbacteria bacterium]|nr:hypothetical protein [Candidatus Uhrbacteria bacterium]
MQEDRPSLYPEQFVWLKSVRPQNEVGGDFTLMNAAGLMMGFINWVIYCVLSVDMFDGIICYLSCILVSVTFAGFVHQFMVKPNDLILRLTVLGTAFVLGMMAYQLYF